MNDIDKGDIVEFTSEMPLKWGKVGVIVKTTSQILTEARIKGNFDNATIKAMPFCRVLTETGLMCNVFHDEFIVISNR